MVSRGSEIGTAQERKLYWMAQDAVWLGKRILDKMSLPDFGNSLGELNKLLEKVPTEEAYTALVVLSVCEQELGSSGKDLKDLHNFLQKLAAKVQELEKLLASPSSFQKAGQTIKQAGTKLLKSMLRPSSKSQQQRKTQTGPAGQSDCEKWFDDFDDLLTEAEKAEACRDSAKAMVNFALHGCCSLRDVLQDPVS